MITLQVIFMLLFNIQFLFNHASHTQHNSCTYVQVVDLQMERDSNIYTHSAKLKP